MSEQGGFAVWITGMPSSGKSTITGELAKKMRDIALPVVVLESDEMRTILTPEASYSQEERDRFYRTLASIGALITRNGINVIYDATANKRAYRDHARTLIPGFVEAYVQCPLEICMQRDPKGIYRRAAAGAAATVPGVQSPYEPPVNPEITLDCQAPPAHGADAIIEKLRQLLHI
jgi:adenylylsulfate kinase